MNPQSNDDAPDVPNRADDSPRTPASHLAWRLGGLLIGSFVAIALLGELVKLVVGADS